MQLNKEIDPMLVLSRRQNESIVIGDDVVITVAKIRGNQVHLALDAPKDMPIHRREVYEAIANEQRVERMKANLPEKFEAAVWI